MASPNISNPAHIDFIAERGAVRLAENIGLDICPLCSLQDIPSVLQDDSPKVVFHSLVLSQT